MHGPVPSIARRRRVAACCLLCASAPGAAVAGDLTVRLDGLRSGAGQVLVAVCGAATFTRRDCAIKGSAPAGEAVVLRDVPPGDYAVQAVHDENANGDLDRGLFLPTEGIGFSRDAPMRRGPPTFADAAIRVGPDGGTISLTMRYFR